MSDFYTDLRAREAARKSGADTDLGTVVNVAHNLVPFYQRGRVMTIAHGESERRHRRLYWTQPHSTNGSRPYVFVGRRLSKHREYLVSVDVLSRDPLCAVFRTSPSSNGA